MYVYGFLVCAARIYTYRLVSISMLFNSCAYKQTVTFISLIVVAIWPWINTKNLRFYCSRKFGKKPPTPGAQRSFVEFILEPVYKVFSQVLK